MEGNNQWGPFHDPVYPEGVPCQPDKTGLLYIQTWKILQFSNQHFLILSNTSSSLLMSMTGAQQEWYARKSQNQCCWLLSSCSLFKKGDTGLIARRCRKFLIVFFDLTAKNKHGQIGPPLHQTEYNLFKLSKLWMPMIWTNEYEHKGQRSLLYWCKSWILEKIQKIVQRAQGMASPIINHCVIRHIWKNFKNMPDLQNMTGTGAVEPVIGESGKPTPVVGGRREAQGLTPPTASSPPVIALTWTQSILIRKFNHKKKSP